LNLAQHLDPRDEISRLLDWAKTYLPRVEITAEKIQSDFDNDDVWAAALLFNLY
jgi:hypothetical protein